MQLSIIIPTFNEAARIVTLIQHLRACSSVPIYVANSPNTTDATAALAQSTGVEVIACPLPGRAAQMNYATTQCGPTDVYYFVHADTLPPKTFVKDIERALQTGHSFGYFSYRFDSKRPLLRINSYFTRYNGVFAGGGDQTLFIKKSTFDRLEGFEPSLKLMEDFDLVARARQAGYSSTLIPKEAIVSARKYEHNTWLRVNLVNLWIFILFHLGVTTDRLCVMYRRLLN